MRELIDLLTLVEATGLAGRKPGDPFKSQSGKVITFNDITFYPESGGKLAPADLTNIVQQVSRGAKIHWQNQQTGQSGGFALINFSSEDGTYTIGRFLKQVHPDPKQNTINNTFVIDGEEYKFASKSAAKEQSPLKPTDLLTELDDLDIVSIMNQLAESLGTDSPLYELAHKIAIGTPLPISIVPPADITFEAFRDYFCEILQPIALQKGQFTGNAMEAAERFLDGSFEGVVASFGQSKNGGLTDSVLTNSNGNKLLISTKGGSGAEASARNLYDQVEKLKSTPDGSKFLRKFSKEVQLLDDMISSGQAGAPLKLAVDANIIDEKEAAQVKELRQWPKIDLANVGGLKLTPRLRAFAKARGTKTPESVNLYFHLIAEIAERVADHVNKTTNFPKAAAEILNNSALVQVYTKASAAGGKWTLNEFDTVYPGESIKGVFLSSGKNYYSTDIKGNFTFLIDKGKGVPKDKADPEPKAKLKDPGKSMSADVITHPDRKKRSEPKDLGRQRR